MASDRSEFDIQSDTDNNEKEGVLHPDFFDINVKSDSIRKEIEYIKKRLDERKKVQIKHAMRMNRRLTKEQERNKEMEEREKCESYQGDVIEEPADPSSATSREEEKVPNDDSSEIFVESGNKVQDDPQSDTQKISTNQSSKEQQQRKPVMILTQEEIKERLDNNIEEINSKIESRVNISKRLIYRDLDRKMMDMLSRALISKRVKSPPMSNYKKPRNNSIKKLPPLNPGSSMNRTAQNMRPRNKKIKEKSISNVNQKLCKILVYIKKLCIDIFLIGTPFMASRHPILRPGSASSERRPCSVESKNKS